MPGQSSGKKALECELLAEIVIANILPLPSYKPSITLHPLQESFV